VTALRPPPPGSTILLSDRDKISALTAKRLFDIALSFALIGPLALPMIAIGLVVKISSPGPVIFWSSRIGIDNRIFRMPKFRTMHTDTPHVATHLLNRPHQFVTTIGRILRKTSLDELPQLFSVVKGDMSLVGPRPALFNQYDLTRLRTRRGIHQLLPGITGWAQINGRDDLPIPQKVHYDAYYMAKRSLALDVQIIFKTFLNVTCRKGINH
jgi:O-antigen biosynthesis protein WbqP